MHIVVIADGMTQKEFQDKPLSQDMRVYFVTSVEDTHFEAEAFFYLQDEEELAGDVLELEALKAPVFVNAVSTTLKNLPANCIRINAWPGFLLNKAIEFTAPENQLDAVHSILKGMDWEPRRVPDIVGMISPRIITMIINEAYFALGEDLSSKEEIDIAMKLGTNYPYGPFEWSEKIGLTKIYNLLKQLSHLDKRYIPAPLLEKELNNSFGVNFKY
jgi:3-hydroxybutyryl-CoA dehydrogenase